MVPNSPIINKIITNQLHQWQFSIAAIYTDINDFLSEVQIFLTYLSSFRRTKVKAVTDLDHQVWKMTLRKK